MADAARKTEAPAPSFSDEKDEEYMRQALVIAEVALAAGEVPVGCVLVGEGGEVVGSAGNETVATRNPTRHCELVTVARLAKVGAARGATLYVTVEPCIMCAAALCYAQVGELPMGGAGLERERGGRERKKTRQGMRRKNKKKTLTHNARIGRVVFGCANPRFGGVDSVYRVPDMDIGRGATSYATRSGGAWGGGHRWAGVGTDTQRSAGGRGGGVEDVLYLFRIMYIRYLHRDLHTNST